MVDRVTLATFYQEFKDFSNYLTTKVDSIERQTKITNGRVNKHDTDLALSLERYNACPIRQAGEISNRTSLRSNRIAIFMAVIAIVSVAVNFLSKFI